MPTHNFKFDNFNKNDTNRFAVVLCERIFQLPNDFKIVWLYGRVGSGKTHLLYATKYCFDQKNSVVFITAKDLAEKLVNHNPQSYLKKIEDAELLIIDDIDDLAHKTTTKEVVKLILKKVSKGQRTLLASNCEPKELNVLYEHFFEEVIFADMGITPKERHKEIVTNFLKDTKIEIDQAALELLIETKLTIPQCMRTLRGIERRYNKDKKKINYENMKNSINLILRFYDMPTI